MLTNLFGSSTRVKILKFFLLNPARKYYIRQLARELDIQVNSARRELNKLEEFGLLKSSLEDYRGEENKVKKGIRQKSYRTNKDFVLFEEIRALFVKAQILHKEELIESLKSIGTPELIVFSGVFTGEEEAPADILIVGNLDRAKVRKVISELEKSLGREVDYALISPDDFQYRRDITDVFLYNMLENKRIIAVDNIGIA